MKKLLLAFVLLIPLSLSAENTINHDSHKELHNDPRPELIEKIQDGHAKGVEVMSLNGAVTRAACPYTCEMRGLPTEHCKTWPSPSDPGQCYVWDTRLPQDAVPLGK